MTATNAYDELSGLRLDVGRGYDRRSVETFLARALGIVDDLLRRVTELEDRLAAGGEPSLSAPEMTRSPGDSEPAGDEPAPENEPVAGAELDDWLQSFNAERAPEVVDLDIVDLVSSEPEPETETRLPLRVAASDRATDAPTQPTPWAGWVD